MDLMLDTAARWRLAGVVVGISAAYLISATGLYGPVSSLAVPAFAVCVGMGALAGEVTLPRPERTGVAMASLEVRHVRDYLPQPAAKGVAVLAAALGGLALLVVLTDVAGGWYGPTGSVPPALGALVSVAATLGLAWLVLTQVARSPRAGIDGEHRRRDEEWRRRTASTITAACGVVVSGTLSGALFLGVFAFGSYPGGGVLEFLSTVAGSLALVAFSAYVVMLLRPAHASVTPPVEDRVETTVSVVP